MLAEEHLFTKETPNFSITSSKIIQSIKQLIEDVVPYFNSYMGSSFYLKRSLNENELTQIFVEQSQILIRKKDYPFNVNGELKDIHNLSDGFSDFYFFPNEAGRSTASIYSVESKRLPSPKPSSRMKEYVIGHNKNGGIERYKTERHGKGLNECGILAFIEKEDSNYWLKEINHWITEEAKINITWKEDELINLHYGKEMYCYLESIAHRKGIKDIILHHFWIVLSQND